MNDRQQTCDRCGFSTDKAVFHRHSAICRLVPPNIIDIFLAEPLYILELADRYGVSQTFLRSSLLRYGMSSKAVRERILEVRTLRAEQRQRQRRKRRASSTPDCRCAGCSVPLWNDPADIPDHYDSHLHWHVNFGHVCMRCGALEGVVWVWNRNLLQGLGRESPPLLRKKSHPKHKG